MSTQTVQTAGVAAMPRVNLMPPEIAEAERFRRLQLAMGGAVVLSVVLVGFLYHHARSGISSAQDQLTTAQTQHTQLQGQLTNLSDVSQTYANVQAKRGLLSEAMGQEIRWSYLLNDLSYRIPNDFWLTTIQATENTVGTSATTPTTTQTPGAIGTILFNGVGLSHDDTAAWLDALAKEKGLANPTFSSSSESEIGTRSVYNSGSGADITPAALSNRYNKAGS